MTNLNSIKATVTELLNKHLNYLANMTEEQQIADLYTDESPKTQTDMFKFFRSFDDEKLSIDDVPAWNAEAGFTLQYRELMQ